MTIRGTNAHPARSGSPPSFADFVPAANISFVGIGFRDAAYSYLAPHGNPSGGDWGLQSPGYASSGAVMLEGTEAVTIEECTFKCVGTIATVNGQRYLGAVH